MTARSYRTHLRALSAASAVLAPFALLSCSAVLGTDAPVAIDCTTVHVTTLAGSVLGFADGVGSASLFSTPMGIMVDGAGNILLADSGNQRIPISTARST